MDNAPPFAPGETANHPVTGLPEARPVDGRPRAPSLLWTIVKVIEIRLRFVILMVATALLFGYWDTLANHFEKWRRPSGEIRAGRDRVEYFCPMHPSVVVDTAVHCPICGMPLCRRVRTASSLPPEGVLSQVNLTPGRVAQAGVRTVPVGFARHDEQLTTVGYVSFDESRYFKVASNARGHLRVDRLCALSEGVAVQAGQPLAELYGYDVSQAIRLYLDALTARRHGPEHSNGPQPAPPGDPEERVGLAAQGLKVLGVRQDQIDALTAGNPTSEFLPLLAPISGHVVRKAVYEGQYVSEGEVLYEIADLSRVWVVAQVFEDQLGRVEVGRRIDATVPTFPGELFPGRVALIAPTLNPVTRTAAVRFELDNPGHRLRPGMFATVTLSLTPAASVSLGQTTCPVSGRRLGSMGRALQVEVGGRKVGVCCDGCAPKLKSNPAKYLSGPDPSSANVVLSVPESAVIDTGSRKIVYVESRPGLFEGRAVTLGPRAGDEYPVLAGLAPGERVAAAGAFLIDAETRLNPATRAASTPGAEASGTPPETALARE
jgi:Cu(I)/Ag(I) efflux system membrane fusion protein